MKDKIIRIYTNSISKEEVHKLAKVITNKLKIETKAVHDRNGQYILTISKNQLENLKLTIQKYMHESMLYKLGIYLPIKEVRNTSFNYLKIIKKI